MQYVYLLKCSDGTVYTGCTNNLERRLKEHESGKIEYTPQRQPLFLETYIAFTDKYAAYNFEKYLKSGSGKAFCFKRLVKKDRVRPA